MKRLTIKKVSKYLLGLYIMTLFVFNYDTKLNIVSQVIFILAFGTSIISIYSATQRPKSSFVYYYILSFLLIAFASTFWSIDFNYAVSHNITFLQLMILMFMVYSLIDSIDDVNMLMNSIYIGGLLMCLYAFFYYGIDGIINSIKTGFRLGGEINQENSFGFYSNITFFIGLYKIFVNKNKKYILLNILPLLFIFLSGSRKAIFILIVMIPIFILLVSEKNPVFKIFISIFTITVLYYLVVNSSLSNTLFRRVNQLLNGVLYDSKLDNSTLTRFEMFEFGWHLFKEKPLFGYGTNQYNILYSLQFGWARPSHNNYIQVLVSYGIIGTFVYYSIFIIILYNLYFLYNNNLKQSSIYIILMFILLIHDFGAETMREKLKYIILVISYSYCHIEKYNKKSSLFNLDNNNLVGGKL